MNSTEHNKEKPLIGPEQSLPEITVKGIILAIILTIILCSSNAYLGLKVGTTISASIPAAIIAMGVLRLFKHSNVLENNIVQTAASVGEALVSGVAYVMPALLIIHFWNYFHFWGTLVISLLGGVLGMLFSIPVRRVMLNNPTLRFPEGTAIGEVLKASADSDAELKPLVFGGVAGAILGLFQTGFGIISDSLNCWFAKGKIVFGFGLGFSPALLAAGYIIGINVAISILVGVILGWVCGVPILSLIYGVSDPSNAIASAELLWKLHSRYIGVGTMLIGGVWTILTLLKPIYQGILASFESLRIARQHKGSNPIPRTERDMPINLVLGLVILVGIFLFLTLYYVIDAKQLGISTSTHLAMCGVAVAFVLISGLLFSSIAGYFAGLVGSTNSPVSGMVISNLLLFSLLIVVLFGLVGHLSNAKVMMFSAMVLMVCAILGCVVAIANDTMQDLKAGQIVGATPWKQQVMLILGVVVSSFVIAPILQLLFHAYGIGGVFPHPGMPVQQMLAAPQATIMAAVVQGVFSHSLPWALLFAGSIIAVIAIIIDEYLKPRGLRFPVLAVGLGIYLPLDTSVPLIIGGFLSFFVNHFVHKQRYHLSHGEPINKAIQKRLHRSLLLACGIVAGASVMGVLLAIPFAIEQSATALRLVSDHFKPIADALGVLSTIFLCAWIYKTVINKK